MINKPLLGEPFKLKEIPNKVFYLDKDGLKVVDKIISKYKLILDKE